MAKTEAGNLKLIVPEGYTVRTGTNMGDPDDNQVWFHREPATFFDYYWFILKESESEVDNNISMTKSMNDGKDIPEFTLEGAKWSGIVYMYNDIPCNVLKGVKDGNIFQVTIIGHNYDSDEVTTVLKSMEVK